jgi:hypothetical protein
MGQVTLDNSNWTSVAKRLILFYVYELRDILGNCLVKLIQEMITYNLNLNSDGLCQ